MVIIERHPTAAKTHNHPTSYHRQGRFTSVIYFSKKTTTTYNAEQQGVASGREHDPH